MLLTLFLLLAQSNVRVTGTVPSGIMTVERVNVGGSISLIAKPRIFDGVLDVTLKSNTGTLNGTTYKLTYSGGTTEIWNIPSSPVSTTRAAVITSGGGSSGGGGTGGGTTIGTATFVSEALNGLANGTNPVFTLSFTPLVEPLVFRNGVKQTAAVDYTRSGQTITFVAGAIPQAGDILNAWYSK